MKATIEIVEGYHQGKTLDLQGPTTLGRAPNNTLCVYDNRVSRQHALIKTTPDGEGYILTDLGSGNGTFVNGERLAPDVPRPLQNGDQIFLGTTRISFSLKQPSVHQEEPKHKAPGMESSSHFGDSHLAVKMESGDSAGTEIAHVMDASLDMISAQDNEDKDNTIKRLQAMVQVANDIGQMAKREVLLNRVMSRIFHIFPQADRAFVLLRNPSTGVMVPAVGRRRNAKGGEEEEFPISNTIINTVVEEKKSILTGDAQQDFGAQQSIVDLSLRSLMCSPLIYDDEILGVINVDTVTPNSRFTPDDLALLTGVAALTATALKNTNLFDQVESEIQARSMLSRYMPPDIAKGIVDGTISAEMGGKRAVGTVLFCNVVGFPEMADRMDPVALIDKLNRYFKITTDIISRSGGTLSKFSGDKVLAFWNVILQDQIPEKHAVVAALQMQAADYYFNLDLDKEGEQPIYTGIGINTGELAAGNIGGEHVEYNIIGGNVNLAEYILELAGKWQVLVSEATFAPVRDDAIAIKLPDVRFEGVSAPTAIYSIRGILTGSDKTVLNIPVRALDDKGNLLGDGLITGASGRGGSMKLHFSTEAVVIAGQQVSLHLDLPEYNGGLNISGVVEDESRDTYYGQAVFSKSTIANLQGSEEVFSFLEPGALLESQKSWDELAR